MGGWGKREEGRGRLCRQSGARHSTRPGERETGASIQSHVHVPEVHEQGVTRSLGKLVRPVLLDTLLGLGRGEALVRAFKQLERLENGRR